MNRKGGGYNGQKLPRIEDVSLVDGNGRRDAPITGKWARSARRQELSNLGLDDGAVFKRHNPVHAPGEFEVVGRDQGGEP